MPDTSRSRRSLYLRNVIFGVEDSLVSTVGLLAGIAAGNATREAILLTGFVYIAVEAFSMSVGSYLSEESAEEYAEGKAVKGAGPIFGAIIMFVSFAVAGLFPVAPYLFFDGRMALFVSVGLSIAVLLVLGFVSGLVAGVKPFTRSLRMGLLGGAAIVIGIVVAAVFGVA